MDDFKEEAKRLNALRNEVTEEPLDSTGRHFTDGWYGNLTSCHHGDTGEFHNIKDGEAIALLWNLWKADALLIKGASNE